VHCATIPIGINPSAELCIQLDEEIFLLSKKRKEITHLNIRIRSCRAMDMFEKYV